MEQSHKIPTAEELLKRIQELEVQHAHIKQKISELMHQPKPHRRPIGDTKLTESHYLNIIRSMGQAVHVFDRKYRIRFWNRVAEDIYGLTAAEVYGKTPTEILVDPKDAVMADYLLERTVSGEAWSGEFPVKNKKGETFVIMCTNTPYRDENGRLIGGICIFTDSRPYRQMHQKPSIASKISNLASKVKLKLLTTDDEEDAAQTEESPRGHIGTYPFGVFTEENFTGKRSMWAWNGNERKDESTFTYQEYSADSMVLFKQEVSLMKRLRHPNILLFMGAVTSTQHLCIVTEFLTRGSLFQILQQKSTRLDWRRRVQMAIDIARGMNYLHQYNPPIVHRDLKSSNLLVDKNWTVKVGDFGLSRIKHQTYLKTKSGKGTPQWMAPEIIRNEQADEKSDVYSYGVVLWEIVTRKMPWDDLNPMQVIAAVGFMDRRPEIPNDVDPLWTSLIESCWCSEPQSRPTFQEILRKLKYLQKKYAVKRTVT
ncbi:serine/threonine-protein kinase 52-like [Bidens hawaiensis]|uniref:serine/threonine-protein kinase 52-like n=1 Tax=Bidens hawaiensis TaxID=980011 RepID=UPI00404B215D